MSCSLSVEIGIGVGVGLSIGQCEHTITHGLDLMSRSPHVRHGQCNTCVISSSSYTCCFPL